MTSMAMTKKTPDTHIQALLDPQQALRDYLDALLSEIDVDEGIPQSDNMAESALSGDPEQEVHSDAVEQVPVEPQPVTTGNEPAAATTPEVPEWARFEFQSLSFKVAGLTLAAPLEKLNGIVELEGELSELPGYSPWVLGILNNRGQNVQVIDVAKVIMTGRQLDRGQENPEKGAKFVVLINSGKFGLAADSLSQVLTLSPDDVRWRSANGKRPWLAGTVIEQMCAILDIDHLTRELIKGIQVDN